MGMNSAKNLVRVSRWSKIFSVVGLVISANYASFSIAGASTQHSLTSKGSAGAVPRVTNDPCVPTTNDYETQKGPSEAALRSLITKIDNGDSVEVSAELISLNGQTESDYSGKSLPAKGYPIEFMIGNKVCFAYNDIVPQFSFGDTPINQIAGTFKLSDVPAQYAHIPLQSASVMNHELVGADGLLVGWAMNKTTDTIIPGCNFESCS